MRQIKTTILFFFISILVLGCNSPRQSIETETKENTTITKTIVPRDTTIVVNADNSGIEATLEELKLSQERLMAKSGRSTVYLGYDKTTGKITADCVCDSNAIKVRLYETFIEQLKVIEKNTKETIVNKESTWEKIQNGAVTAFFIGLVGFIVIIVIKIFK